MTSWELQHGFTQQIGSTILLRWDQMSKKYYALKQGTLIAHGTNLNKVRKEAQFYVNP